MFSSEHLNEIAVQHGFKKRNRKIKLEDFIALCAFYHEETGMKSLGQLCATLYDVKNVNVTEEALHQRFNQQAVNFLKTIFNCIFQKQLSDSMLKIENLPFHRIRIVDSTGFKTPTDDPKTGYQGCAQPSLKIQVEYEMKQGQFLHLDIRNGKEHDTTYAATLLHTVQPGDLLLRDLGYFSLDGLKSIHEQGGYYISMVKHNVKIYFTKERTEEPKCAEDFIKDLAPGETMEVHHVYISQKRIPQPRLILYRLTEKQERDREKKWNQRRKKRKHTSKHRQTHPIYAYITNTSVKEIAKEAVYALYSLRWQIEILFKVWKSIFRIHRIKKVKKERLDCHLYGTLISILISSSVTFKIRSFLYQKEKREISEYKTMYIVKEALPNIYIHLFKPHKKITAFFDGLYDLIRKNGKKSKRWDKKSPFDMLEALPG
nr:IS4 family transposase [Aneurinibacillus aneurinilyticus]